jgi:hypothetical protein
MDKFLLAYNPNTEGKSGLFIVHCLHPMAIIEVSKERIHTELTVCTDIGNELFYLSIISSEETDYSKLYRLACRARHWFKAHRSNAQVGLSGLPG